MSLLAARSAADPFASRIATDLDQFTVHDGTHLDGLWPLIDMLVPDHARLSPTEVWTLGVAIILHDLGLAVAAYPGGREELRRLPAWRDARAIALRRRLGRLPTHDELDTRDGDLDRAADEVTLRERHAERAGELVDIEWEDGYRLVEDRELSDALGATAGRIAASHWWSADRLTELGPLEGAPAGMPGSWTVRPILLAAVLRVADAMHIDSGRAPRSERVLRRLDATARMHWDFQSRLRQPTLSGDRIVYTTARPFSADEAGAWWLCLDHMRLLDDELAAVDGLLEEHLLPRLRARSVRGVRDPRVFSRLVRTNRWEPVDAHVSVSDVGRMVGRLGGESLYGDIPAVPLRELIQNAVDAIRARTALQPGFSGVVHVTLDDQVGRLTVSDNGVGMGERVLTGALLDFGRSLWDSTELTTVLPGLAASDFRPTGRFGIGFFSVFMWADDVKVVSRSLRAAEEDTLTLVFPNGVKARPLLRPATDAERLESPGTRIELTLGHGAQPFRDLLEPSDAASQARILYGLRRTREDIVELSLPRQLELLLGWLAPCLEVDLECAIEGGPPTRVVSAGDWKSLDTQSLLRRVTRQPEAFDFDVPLDRIRPLGDPESPSGRIGLDLGETRTGPSGATVCGGLRVGFAQDFFGVLQVDAVEATRTAGVCTANSEQVAQWATAQSELLVHEAHRQPPGTRGFGAAPAILRLGGDPGPVPIARTARALLTANEIEAWARARRRIVVVTGRASLPSLEPPQEPLPQLRGNDYEDAVLVSTDIFANDIVSFKAVDTPSAIDVFTQGVARAWGVRIEDLTGFEVTPDAFWLGREFKAGIELLRESSTG